MARGVPRRRTFAAVVNCHYQEAGVSHAQNCSLAGLYHRRYLCRPKGRGRVSPCPSDKGWLAPCRQSGRFERSPDKQTGRIDPGRLVVMVQVHCGYACQENCREHQSGRYPYLPLNPYTRLFLSVPAQSDVRSIRWGLCRSDSTSIDRKMASRKRTFVQAEREIED
jgi:hypothetical protein